MAQGFTILLFLSACWYAWFILRARQGLQRAAARTPLAGPHKAVSVLIPARNEASTIAPCLDALRLQDYPPDLLEIIVVDDGSTDETASVVSSYAARDPRIRLLQLGPDDRPRPSTKRGRKPEALAKAIGASKGEIIVTTDADCISPTTWIPTLTAYLTGPVVYVVGPVLEDRGDSLLTRVRALEVLGLISMSGGRIGIGRPINGHGGNTAFLRSVFDRAGGFDLDAVKSDEETLLHEVLNMGLGAAAFAATPHARVRTFSPPTLRSYWNQRLRWGSMHGRFKNRGILVELLLLYLSLLAPVVGLVAGFWIPDIAYAALSVYAIKVIVDLAALRSAARILHEPFSPGAFCAGELVHTFVILAVSTVAQFLPYAWKERTVLAVDPGNHQ